MKVLLVGSSDVKIMIKDVYERLQGERDSQTIIGYQEMLRYLTVTDLGDCFVVLFASGSSRLAHDPTAAHESTFVRRMIEGKTKCIVVHDSRHFCALHLQDDSKLNALTSFVPEPSTGIPEGPNDIRPKNRKFLRRGHQATTIADEIKGYTRPLAIAK